MDKRELYKRKIDPNWARVPKRNNITEAFFEPKLFTKKCLVIIIEGKHMKKLLAILITLLAAIAILPVSAQDEETASCTAEEFAEATEEVSTNIVEFLESFDSEEEMDAATLTEAVAELDAYVTGYWEGFGEVAEEDLCAELVWFGYNAGLILDDMLITAQLSAITLHEAEAGNDENAQSFAELAEARSEMLAANAEAFEANMTSIADGGGLSVEYTECTEEDLAAIEEGLEEIAAAYEEIGGLSLEDEESVDFAVLAIGFGTLSNGFWMEAMPSVPLCPEAQVAAFSAGLILDESFIIAGLYYLAEAEATMGNEELATALMESAEARTENLMAALEEMDGTE